MSLEVFLHPSTTSPSPAVFQAAMDRALATIGATRAEDGEGVALADGSSFELYLDDHDDIALATLSIVNDAVVDAVYVLAAETRSFLMSAGFVWRLPETGDVVPALAMGFPQATLVNDRLDLRDMLDSAVLAAEGPVEDDDRQPFSDEEIEAAALAAGPPPEADPIVSTLAKPFLQRLSDALFGKSI
ncbi:MAG TPA: hypothetical protein PLO65_12240 [Caulobacter sp.]|nr:hypothetical protein [Caulobacter sp.]